MLMITPIFANHLSSRSDIHPLSRSEAGILRSGYSNSDKAVPECTRVESHERVLLLDYTAWFVEVLGGVEFF